MLDSLLRDLPDRTAVAVRHFWRTRDSQAQQQAGGARPDTGARSAVTGGAQMDGFIDYITSLLSECGFGEDCVFTRKRVELPGYYRPEKKWDLVVLYNSQLLAALEAKSHIGPSFGNNFNNRTEEAMGSSRDFWAAFREKAFTSPARPWLGYLMFLEDAEGSRREVRPKQPHYKVLPGFEKASYRERYRIFCERLVLENDYNAATLLTSDRESGPDGNYSEPYDDLRLETMLRSLLAHVMGAKS